MLRKYAIEFVLTKSTPDQHKLKRQKRSVANATCRRKAARFFQNVHNKWPFLVREVGNMHKKREQRCALLPFSLWPLFNEFGLNLGNLAVNLVADELHEIQQQLSVGNLENTLFAV